MKRFLALIVSTCVVIGLIYFMPSVLKQPQKVVDVISITPVDAQRTMSVSGSVEYANSQPVNSSTTALIKKVYVKSGDRVEKGTKLYTLSELKLKGMPTADQLHALQSVDDAVAMISAKENYIEVGKVIDVCSPSDGVVACMSLKENDVVMANATLCNVVDPSEFLIRAMVNESQVSNIKVGQSVRISGTGFDGEYDGKVDAISTEAHSVRNLSGERTCVDIVIKPDSVIPHLKHGFTVKCKIVTERSENVMMVPYEALDFVDGKSYVRKVNSDGTMERIPVITGREYEGGIEIVRGVNMNDIIVEKGD